MSLGIDYVQLAMTSTRQAFVAGMPYTFIISDGTLPRQTGSVRMVSFDKLDLQTTQESPPTVERQPRLFVILPIRKVNDTFPNMITLGRTGNNDLVVADVSISKFHAFFREGRCGFEVADAGSKNGSWVAGVALAPRGDAVPVKVGDRLRFGRIAFTVVDAAACWDAVDRMRR